MSNQAAIWNRVRQFARCGSAAVLIGCAALLLSVSCLPGSADAAGFDDGPREEYVPVLCVTMEEASTGKVIRGKVIYIMVLFTIRNDAEGLDVHFTVGPGRFTPMTQTAAKEAIATTARTLGLSSDSWSVGLGVLEPGLIINGPSLSAMVGLAVAAMAKGESIPRNRVITGTITSDGHIGPVGGVGPKILAALQAGLQMVLVPSTDIGKVKTPDLTKVFKVGSVRQAYEALTASHRSIVGVRKGLATQQRLLADDYSHNNSNPS
jgi:predicted S18 family serine protease